MLLELKYKLKDKELLISQELKNSVNSNTNKIIKLEDKIKILEANINNINQFEIGNNNNVNINQNMGENENIKKKYEVPEELINKDNKDNEENAEENEEFKNYSVEEM